MVVYYNIQYNLFWIKSLYILNFSEAFITFRPSNFLGYRKKQSKMDGLVYYISYNLFWIKSLYIIKSSSFSLQPQIFLATRKKQSKMDCLVYYNINIIYFGLFID